jgi:GH15 family glucan-1,4-alpha-glucosidase
MLCPNAHPAMRAYSAISDYAIIGNCRTAALIDRSGSLDWLCLPRFDSPSMFGALLDARKGGRFRVGPVGSLRGERRYIADTNVLETEFTSETGVLKLTDFMPVDDESAKARTLWPEHEIVRVVECVAGSVDVEVFCDPQPDYARRQRVLKRQGALGFIYSHGRAALVLRSELPVEPIADGSLYGRQRLLAGQRLTISLTFDEGEPAVLSPLGDWPGAQLQSTLAWWRAWAKRCQYSGPYRTQVVRSALLLKLMTFAPSGAVIAAPTTSLPEKIGGVRNWDYRYCWLRDASLTLRALFELDYNAEAEAFLAWLLHTTALSWPELLVLYDVYGETRIPERELPHLEGYLRSRPVRIGNAARDQLQLDVYGEVVGAAFRFTNLGGHIDHATAKLLRGLGTTICKRWPEPDAGIWEIRGGLYQHTVSKALSWVALELLLRMHQAGHLRVPVEPFQQNRAALQQAIETRGYNSELDSYVAIFDSDVLDASLLLLPLHGYLDHRAPRMCSTARRIREQLGRNGLLYRYAIPDGLPQGEGTFTVCSFWDVIQQAGAGELHAARSQFEYLLGFANDVGLYAEELDPDTGAALGNFPQAFTHLGLINAALALEQAARGASASALAPLPRQRRGDVRL